MIRPLIALISSAVLLTPLLSGAPAQACTCKPSCHRHVRLHRTKRRPAVASAHRAPKAVRVASARRTPKAVRVAARPVHYHVSPMIATYRAPAPAVEETFAPTRYAVEDRYAAPRYYEEAEAPRERVCRAPRVVLSVAIGRYAHARYYARREPCFSERPVTVFEPRVHYVRYSPEDRHARFFSSEYRHRDYREHCRW